MAKKAKAPKAEKAAEKKKRGPQPRKATVKVDAYHAMSAKQKKKLSPVTVDGKIVGYAPKKKRSSAEKAKASAGAKKAAKKGGAKRKAAAKKTRAKTKSTGKRADGSKAKKAAKKK